MQRLFIKSFDADQIYFAMLLARKLQSILIHIKAEWCSHYGALSVWSHSVFLFIPKFLKLEILNAISCKVDTFNFHSYLWNPSIFEGMFLFFYSLFCDTSTLLAPPNRDLRFRGLHSLLGNMMMPRWKEHTTLFFFYAGNCTWWSLFSMMSL